MELMNQPFTGQLGKSLIELLNSGEYNTLNITVAFAKNSGVLRIKDALKRFREQGGVVNVYVGLDLGGTSYEALTTLLLHTDSLSAVHSESGQTFHSKIYQFLTGDKALMVVGSHNLTAGGLWTNFESSVIFKVDKSSPEGVQVLEGFDNYIKSLKELKGVVLPIASQEDINQLLKNGYVLKEVTERISRIKNTVQNKGPELLFGNSPVAKLPHLSPWNEEERTKVSKAFEEVSGDMDQTIWFETRRMTGGSRNILDLSKKSLVEHGDPTGTPFDLSDPRFMRGGVEFFGLNPADTSQSKNITINFEGVDYSDNTILFPLGESANGTWRLQIKGVSPSGERITESFRVKEEEHYLVEKIITFTKVNSDYYHMSVFPESELKNFEIASRILARNGLTKSAKRLGLL